MAVRTKQYFVTIEIIFKCLSTGLQELEACL